MKISKRRSSLAATPTWQILIVTRTTPSRIVHLSGRSLIGRVLGRIVCAMFGKVFARRFATLLLALGVFLSGALPTWATPSMPGQQATHASISVARSGMRMWNDCMSTMDRSMSKKNVPCKGSDSGCAAVCTSCALPIALLDGSALLPMLYRGGDDLLAADVNRNGIRTPPALPPPILRA